MDYHVHTTQFTPIPVVFLTLSTIALSLRIWVKVHLMNAMGADDWLLITAQFFFALLCFIYFVVSRIEGGKTLEELPTLKLNTLSIIAVCFYIMEQISFKLSLAIFFLRIVKERWQKWIIKSTVILYIIHVSIFMLMVTFRCGRPNGTNFTSDNCKLKWDGLLGPLAYSTGAGNALMDWIFALTPLLVITRMNMSHRDKVSVCSLIGLAVVGSIVSIIRIPYIGTLKFGPEFYAHDTTILMWSIAESGIGNVAISLATLRPLVRLIRSKMGYKPDASDQSAELPRVQAFTISPFQESSADRSTLKSVEHSGTSLATVNAFELPSPV